MRVVEQLLAAGALMYPEPEDIVHGPLAFACRGGCLAVVELLMGAGADVHSWGDVALSLASAYGHFCHCRAAPGRGRGR